ncbi:MAG: hypothetical protein AAF456_07535 [Planctomycetota bacterium]
MSTSMRFAALVAAIVFAGGQLAAAQSIMSTDAGFAPVVQPQVISGAPVYQAPVQQPYFDPMVQQPGFQYAAPVQMAYPATGMQYPQQYVPGTPVYGAYAPVQGTPMQTMPMQTMPMQGMPVDGTVLAPFAVEMPMVDLPMVDAVVEGTVIATEETATDTAGASDDQVADATAEMPEAAPYVNNDPLIALIEPYNDGMARFRLPAGADPVNYKVNDMEGTLNPGESLAIPAGEEFTLTIMPAEDTAAMTPDVSAQGEYVFGAGDAGLSIEKYTPPAPQTPPTPEPADAASNESADAGAEQAVSAEADAATTEEPAEEASTEDAAEEATDEAATEEAASDEAANDEAANDDAATAESGSEEG